MEIFMGYCEDFIEGRVAKVVHIVIKDKRADEVSRVAEIYLE